MAKMKMLGMDSCLCGPLSQRRLPAAARRSATRFCRWRCWNRRSRFWTRPTPAWTSTRLKIVAEGVNRLLGPSMGALVIHALSAPARLHQAQSHQHFVEGRVVMTGGAELALELERTGYESISRAVLAIGSWPKNSEWRNAEFERGIAGVALRSYRIPSSQFRIGRVEMANSNEMEKALDGSASISTASAIRIQRFIDIEEGLHRARSSKRFRIRRMNRTGCASCA